jgi:DNA-binding NtrC family response regulator
MARILVVDDNDLLSRALARHLRRGGHAVDCEPSVARALASLGAADGAYDVVFADVHLADGRVDGLILAARRRFPALPFVLTTGSMGTPYPHDGVVAMLFKPFAMSAADEALAHAGIRGSG